MSVPTNTSLASCFSENQYSLEAYLPHGPQPDPCNMLQVVDLAANTFFIPVANLFMGPLFYIISNTLGEGLHAGNEVYCKGATLKEVANERAFVITVKAAAVAVPYLFPLGKEAPVIALKNKNEAVTAIVTKASSTTSSAASSTAGEFEVLMTEPAQSMAVADDALLKTLEAPMEITKKTEALLQPITHTFVAQRASTPGSGIMGGLARIATSIVNAVAYIFQGGREVEAHDQKGMAHLLQNVEQMNSSSISERLGNFELYDIHSKGNCNPFLYAANNAKFTRELQQMGGFPHPVDDDGRHPIHLASLAGNREVVQLHLSSDKSKVNLEDKNFKTSLFYALSHEELGITQDLVAAGADVNIQRGKDHFIHLAYQKRSMDLFNALAEGKDFNVDAKGDNGSTLLLFAVANNDKKWIELLKELGANPDIKNHDGVSAKILAENEGKTYFKD